MEDDEHPFMVEFIIDEHKSKWGHFKKYALYDKRYGELSIHDVYKSKKFQVIENKIILNEWELSDLLEWIKTL